MTTTHRLPRPRLENLEDRLTPSSYVSNGDLYIVTGNGNDTVTVSIENYGGTYWYKVVENGAWNWHQAGTVTGGDIVFYGYGGNDYFRHTTWLRGHAYGMDGNDTLIGSDNTDFLYGGNGSDSLYGYGGNDTLMAGLDGSDNFLAGMDGNDLMYGGHGSDDMYGGNGDDYLYGNLGADSLYGGNDDDTLDGGDDGVRDLLNGGAGHDSFQRDWYGGPVWWTNLDTPVDFTLFVDSYYDAVVLT